MTPMRRHIWMLRPALALALFACGSNGGGADTPATDARVPEMDAAPPTPDASPPRADASPAPVDAARPPLDAAEVPPDAPAPPPDARVAPDAADVEDAARAADGQLPPDALQPDAAPPIRPDPTTAVFATDRLHIVEIAVDENDLAALENDRENRVPCDIVFDGIELPNSGIRQKGGIGSVSSLAAKPGFSIKFDQFDEDQDLYGLEKLVLNNAIQDRTLLHEHIGLELSRQLGVPAQRTAHALVRLNGHAYGIFVVVESVDGDFLRRWFGEDQDGGNLYEGPCCADFVYDIPHMELKDEDDGRVRDDLEALAAAVRDTSDADFPEAVEARLDVRNFILGYALDAALRHWDGYAYNVNNHYIYHRPSDDRFVFMPHGMDQVLQDVGFNPFDGPNGRLAQRIRENPRYDALFAAAIRHIATDVWDVDFVRDRAEAVRRVLSQAPRGEPNVERDLAWFEESLPFVINDFAARKAVLLNSLGQRPEPPPPPPEPVCTPADHAGRNYLFCNEILDADTAAARCADAGGLLAWPEDAADQGFLVDNAPALSGGDAWIGVDDRANEGDWRRADGAPAAFTAWGDGRPNGAQDQNCVMMDFALGGGWNDRDCAELHPFVCRLP